MLRLERQSRNQGQKARLTLFIAAEILPVPAPGVPARNQGRMEGVLLVLTIPNQLQQHGCRSLKCTIVSPLIEVARYIFDIILYFLVT